MNIHNRTDREINERLCCIECDSELVDYCNDRLEFFDLITKYRVSIQFNKIGTGGVCEIHKENSVHIRHFTDDSELMRAVCLAIIESVGGWE